MSDTSELTSQIYITVGGSEIQRALVQQISQVVVDQNAHLPGYFTIRLHDPGLELLDSGPFDLTKEVEIKAQTASGQKVTLIRGEITSLEPSFGEGMIAELTVRGYDSSHRMFRDMVTKSYLNKKDSDLAAEIAQAAGLRAEVEPTRTVYEHIFQHNQSDLAFLMERAWRIGYECFVAEGKLFFRKPPTGDSGLKVTWGDDLLSFQPRITLAEQVDEVVVKGWDPEKQEAIVGIASKGKLYPKVGESKDGASWAKAFGKGRLVIVDQPVTSQAEAEALAAARLDEISGAFVEAEGVAFRRPDLRAGQTVKIEGLGQRYSGTYLVTGVRHEFRADGLKTTFWVRGTRSGLLADELAGGEKVERWPGVVIGVVTNTDDPKDMGRVKVKFPWMSGDAESQWARVLGIGAGPEAGLYVMPDVEDEVLVIFEHGDFNRPFVLGGLWNGKHKIPPEAAGAAGGEAPLVRTWRSRGGHWIAMFDDSKKKIEIVTAGGRSITLDDNGKTITVKTNGVTLKLEDNQLSIESQADISIKAGANLKLEASGNLDIKAGGNVNVNGALINLN